MKIGINARFLSRGYCGNLTYLKNLIKGLIKYDDTNEYVFFVNDPECENMFENYNKSRFKFVTVNDKKHDYKSDYEWDMKFTDTEEFRSQKIDILHCTHFAIPDNIYKEKSLKNIKIVASIHDLFPTRVFRVRPFIEMGLPIREISMNGLFLRLKEPKMIQNIDRIITFSDFIKRDILRFYDYPEENIAVIPHFPADNFVQEDITANRMQRIRLEKIKNKYKLPEKFILYFGGYHRRKNIPTLLKAFDRVIKQFKNVYLVFAGTGKLQESLQKKKLPNIKFIGRVPANELPSVISLSQFTISPSTYEGFGLVVVESMKCGKICLSSKKSPMEEVAQDSSLYFNPYDKDDIYKTIITVLKNPKLRKELEGKTSSRLRYFTEEKHIKDTISVYKQLIN